MLKEIARRARQDANIANAAVVVKFNENPDKSFPLGVVSTRMDGQRSINGLHINRFKRAVFDRLKLDVLLIDTHPGVNEETLLSIAISDLLLLIMRPDNQDFRGPR